MRRHLPLWLCTAILAATAACGGEDSSIQGPTLTSDATTDAGDVSIDTAGGDTGDDTAMGGDTSGRTDDATVEDTGTAGTDDATVEDTGTAGTDDATVEDTSGSTDDATVEDTSGSTDDATVEDTSGSTDDAGSTTCKEVADCNGKLTLSPCQVAACTDGVCNAAVKADGTACDDGSTCTENDTCSQGSCVGAAKVCDDGNPCTNDICDDLTGKCATAPVTDGEACDDGDACTEKDACAEGKCKGGAKACDDGNPCTDDSCNPTSGCVVVNNDKPCGDNNKCFAGGKCADGACTGASKVACDDGNPCTDDTCDSGTGNCKYSANTAPCEDGDKCTTGDVCANSACKAAKITACDDGNPCTDDSCDKTTGQCTVAPKVDGVACDDGDKCSENDSCKGGTCKAGAAKFCDDGKLCTDDACDPKTGCTAKNNTAPCSGDACKLGACASGACVLGTKTGCDDGNPCTTDVCDTKTNSCTFTPVANGTVCGDGTPCVDKSTCAAGKCQPGAKIDCDDGNPCTNDTCDPATGCKWTGNKAPCDDGDKCTTGDACNNGSCAKGTPLDVAKACDDGNPCTDQACDSGKGCLNPANSAPCDDGSICTSNDACKDGKCQGGDAGKCDDGKPCTNDLCDPKTGDCSWSANTGACDDGDPCTANDACAAGKCAGTAKSCDDSNNCTTDSCDAKTGACLNVAVAGTVACDDGSKCTKDDTCKDGKCTGGGAPVCDDGNACTDDTCDPATGNCSFGPNSAPCNNGDKCTFGDTCKNGKCITGSSQSCDDGTSCTTDSCDAVTGACKFTPVADGTACTDGFACTTKEACAAGKCVAGDTSACAVFTDTFECADAGKGWTLDKPQGKNVIWAVDQTPAGIGTAQFGCNLNFNDGTDYCDATGGGCQTPSGNATSPVIDGTKLKSSGRIRFNVYYDLDTCFNGQTDRPQMQILAETGNTVLHTYVMSTSGNNLKQWRLETRIVPEVKGQKFRIRFNLFNPNAFCGNAGTGYFVDNLIVDDQVGPEVCDDGVDNDGNGQIDCADVTCKGKGACVEICDDGKDNDFDDAIDCKDSDCAQNIACTTTTIWSQAFDCGDIGWNYASMNQAVAWAIDGTPAAVVPQTGKCSLNFNNGTNFCGTGPNCTSNQSSNASAGTASWSKKIDATAYTKVYATYWSYIDAEPLTNQTLNFDRGWLQATTDNYAGCCGATINCQNGQLNTCNTNGTATYLAPRTAADQKKWQKVTVDLTKFAGKQFDLRFRFSSGDGQTNNGAGWFVDDLTVLGSK